MTDAGEGGIPHVTGDPAAGVEPFDVVGAGDTGTQVGGGISVARPGMGRAGGRERVDAVSNGDGVLTVSRSHWRRWPRAGTRTAVRESHRVRAARRATRPGPSSVSSRSASQNQALQQRTIRAQFIRQRGAGVACRRCQRPALKHGEGERRRMQEGAVTDDARRRLDDRGAAGIHAWRGLEAHRARDKPHEHGYDSQRRRWGRSQFRDDECRNAAQRSADDVDAGARRAGAAASARQPPDLAFTDWWRWLRRCVASAE